MAPPQLAGDAPRADVVHPVEIDLRVVLGVEAHRPARHRLDRRLGQLVHRHEPLQGDERLDALSGSLGERHRVLVGLGASDQAPGLQPGDHLALGLGDGQPPKRLRGLVGDPPVLADHRGLGEAVAAADLEVVGVVGGRDLQRARPELGPDVIVGDDLQLAPDERQDRRLADHPPVAIILRIDRDRGVGEHRLGADGGNRDRARAARQRVVDVVERVADVARLDLQVGDRRARPRVPVDHVAIAIDAPLLIQGDEHPEHGPGVGVVEREALGRVVRRGAEALELGDHRPAVLRAPFPHPLHERLAAELLARRALGDHLALDLGLGGDAGVVGPEDPFRAAPSHSLVADERVLDRPVQRMAQVQHAGDVGRRDRDRVVLGRGARRLGVKQSGLQPLREDPGLHLGGVVAGLLLQLGHERRECRSG